VHDGRSEDTADVKDQLVEGCGVKPVLHDDFLGAEQSAGENFK